MGSHPIPLDGGPLQGTNPEQNQSPSRLREAPTVLAIDRHLLKINPPGHCCSTVTLRRRPPVPYQSFFCLKLPCQWTPVGLLGRVPESKPTLVVVVVDGDDMNMPPTRIWEGLSAIDAQGKTAGLAHGSMDMQ